AGVIRRYNRPLRRGESSRNSGGQSPAKDHAATKLHPNGGLDDVPTPTECKHTEAGQVKKLPHRRREEQAGRRRLSVAAKVENKMPAREARWCVDLSAPDRRERMSREGERCVSADRARSRAKEASTRRVDY